MRPGPRTSRIGRNLLLIALTIQGFTPDFRNLASPWLIRLLACSSAEMVPGEPAAPLSPQDHQDGPSEFGAPASLDAIPRNRYDSSIRPCAALPPPAPSERWIAPALGSCHFFGIAERGSHDLIRSLCRFLF